jgi:cell division protein FtsZ
MREGPLADLFRSTGEPPAEETADAPAGAEESGAAANANGAANGATAIAERRPAPEPPAPEPDRLAEPAPGEVSVYRVGDAEGSDRAEAPPEPEARVEVEPPPVESPDAPAPRERLRTLLSEPADERPAFGRDVPSASSRPGPEVRTPVIRVVGVGGAGVNAVNRMVEAEIPAVEFMAVNTDLQSLQISKADLTVHIGGSVTRGLGSGSDPELGYRAAFEEQDKVKRLLKGSDMVFVTAGAGGGTGTGAAPVIARLARDVGALTVGIVTRPFRFEGSRREKQAAEGIEALADEVDTLIVVPNERLLSVLSRNTSMIDAFAVADDVLRQGVQAIADLVTLPALINLDFADVRTTMRDAGPALLGIGMGTGDRRALFAAERAISSPLLDTSVEGARSIMLSITGGRDLSLIEVSEAARAVQEAAHPDANIIFGANVDERLDEQVWVTVIATRFDAHGRRADGTTTGQHRTVARPSSRRPAERAGVPGYGARPRDLGIEAPEFLPSNGGAPSRRR